MSSINVTNSKPVNTKYSNVFKLIPVVILSTTVSLAGCAGRTADPVKAYKVTDSGMGCSEIKAELAHIDSQVAGLVSESEKTGKNVALGVTGWFLIVPWFFMDLGDAEQTEIKAYSERYVELEKLYVRKGCQAAAEPSGQQDQIVSSDNVKQDEGQKTIGERLSLLEDLKDRGLITEAEYAEMRNAVLSKL